MIAQQKAAEGEALVSTVLFSNESKVIHDRIDVRRVEPLTEVHSPVARRPSLFVE